MQPFTLLCDEFGLLCERGHIPHPREFRESRPTGSVFRRVGHLTFVLIEEEVGDMVPTHPGEFSHVEISQSLFDRLTK